MQNAMRKALLSIPLLAVFLAPGLGNAFVISTCGVPALCTVGTPTEGWDGPGLNSVSIDYYVGNPFQTNNGIPNGILLADFDAAISAAMSTWSSVVQITFNRVNDATSGLNPFDAALFPNPQIVIYAAQQAAGIDHGDLNPFDGAWNPGSGAGNVLAHAFGPPDIDGGSGNVHLDGQETWVTSAAAIGPSSATIDLETILLHELGHSLGLDHINDDLFTNLGIVMQPGYFGPLTTLAADDIAGIQSLYCPTGTNCGAPPNGAPEPGILLLMASGLISLRLARKV